MEKSVNNESRNCFANRMEFSFTKLMEIFINLLFIQMIPSSNMTELNIQTNKYLVTD